VFFTTEATEATEKGEVRGVYRARHSGNHHVFYVIVRNPAFLAFGFDMRTTSHQKQKVSEDLAPVDSSTKTFSAMRLVVFDLLSELCGFSE